MICTQPTKAKRVPVAESYWDSSNDSFLCQVEVVQTHA